MKTTPTTTGPGFAVINLDNGVALRNVNGEIITWPTFDAAFDRAFDLVTNFEIIEVAS